MRRWLLLAWALSTCALSGQTLVPVVAVWDVATSEHHESATWELERDGAIYPCALTSVSETERRCMASVPAGTATFRLRGVTTGAGPWSTAVVATVAPPQPGEPPGAFAIQWHRFTTAQEPGEMATLEGQAVHETNGSPTQVTLTVAPGDTLFAIAAARSAGSGITGVSDPTNGAWTFVAVRQDDPDAAGTALYVVSNTATGSLTVTSHQDNSSGATYLTVARFSGVTTTVLDSDTNSTSPGTTQSHGSITTAGASLIITGFTLNGGGHSKTPASGFTALDSLDPNDWRPFNQYRISPSGETTGGAFTSSGTNAGRGVIAAFALADAGGGGNRRRRVLMQQ